MRITEEQAQKLGIKPECNCTPRREIVGDVIGDEFYTHTVHEIFCPLGEWLKTRRALGVG